MMHILRLLESTRVTRELKARPAPPEQKQETQPSTALHLRLSSADLRRDPPPKLTQFPAIRTPLPYGDKFSLVPGNKTLTVSPIATIPAPNASAARAFADWATLRSASHKPAVIWSSTYRTLQRAHISDARGFRATSETMSPPDMLHALYKPPGLMMQPPFHEQPRSYHTSARALEAIAMTPDRVIPDAGNAIRDLEMPLNAALRSFIRSPIWRYERSNTSTLVFAARRAANTPALSNAALTPALAIAATAGKAGSNLIQPPGLLPPAFASASTSSTVPSVQAPITINYSPNVTIHAEDTADNTPLSQRVMEVLTRHGRELNDILARNQLRRQRTEY
jgi:hypothetical protein